MRIVTICLTGVLTATVAIAAAGVADAQGAPPRPIVVVQKNRTIDIKDTMTVAVSRVTARRPVTVQWGDGATTTIRVTCSARQAIATPRRCAAQVHHPYTSSGRFPITVQRGRTLLLRTEVEVAGGAALGIPEGDPTWRRQMLGRVNDLRRAVGAEPLTLCAPLETAASRYAAVMAERNHYDHVGPDGRQPWDRMADGGYDWTLAGENIAGGQQNVAEVVTAWRNSPLHYDNLVNPRFTHVGFGYALDDASDLRTYWVQDFGSGGTCT